MQAELWGGVEPVRVTELGIASVGELLARQARRVTKRESVHWDSPRPGHAACFRISSIASQAGGDALYLHDGSVETFCPGLMGELRSARYFPVDYLQAAPY